MRLWTREQAQQIDRETVTSGQNSMRGLVEAAGAGIAAEMEKIPWLGEELIFLAGPGLNGDDARVAARLWEGRKRVRIIAAADFSEADFSAAISGKATVIDGLFGTGLNRPIPEAWIQIFKKLRAASVIAIDIPSGLDANTGQVLGGVLRARLTLALGAVKPGLLMQEGPEAAGRVRVVPMPFPEEIVRRCATDVFLFGANAARRLLPARPATAHKYRFGELRLIAGSPRYRGAAVLTARAALRAGVGFVHLLAREEVFPEWFEIPETTFRQMKGFQEAGSWEEDSWVVGPGVEDRFFIEEALQWLLQKSAAKVVLDAEALRVLAGEPRGLPSTWVLTPHAGEAAALLGVTSKEIDADRLQSAQALARKFGCAVVLKGFRPVVSTGLKSYIVGSGNSALAKAGSGDVLAGILGGLSAQMPAGIHSILLATWVHGALADDWVRMGRDRASLVPSDLIERMPEFLRRFREASSRN